MGVEAADAVSSVADISIPSLDITAALRAAQKPVTRHLWVPEDAITFTPAVLGTIFGDGRALFAITTINNRPAYWLFRGCSTWQLDLDCCRRREEMGDIRDHLDDIITAIEEEFGTCDYYELNAAGRWIDTETGRFVPMSWAEYPVINTRDGSAWGRRDWPDLPGVELEQHPFANDCRILATHLATPESTR